MLKNKYDNNVHKKAGYINVRGIQYCVVNQYVFTEMIFENAHLKDYHHALKDPYVAQVTCPSLVKRVPSHSSLHSRLPSHCPTRHALTYLYPCRVVSPLLARVHVPFRAAVHDRGLYPGLAPVLCPEHARDSFHVAGRARAAASHDLCVPLQHPFVSRAANGLVECCAWSFLDSGHSLAHWRLVAGRWFEVVTDASRLSEVF